MSVGNGRDGSVGPVRIGPLGVAALAATLGAMLTLSAWQPGEAGLMATSAGANAAGTLSSRAPAGLTVSVYGWSGLGRPLLVAAAGRGEPNALVVFGIHGYEDVFPADGERLVDLAGTVAARLADGQDSPNGQDSPVPVGSQARGSVWVVLDANPDGLAEGWTEDGPGRCQVAAGIDVNRDFPAGFRRQSDPRYLTGATPFSSPEARALGQLVARVQPDVVIDVHGWQATCIGDKAVASTLAGGLGLGYGGPKLRGGTFVAWAASQGCRAALVELRLDADNAGRLPQALGWCLRGLRPLSGAR